MARKGSRTLRSCKSLKKAGIFAGISSIVQALIWIVMTSFGIFCFFQNIGKFTENFKRVYMDFDSHTSPSKIIKPYGFFVILIFYLVLSFVWLIASVNLLIEFKVWNYIKGLKCSAGFWITVTTVVCIADLIFFLLVLTDLICISVFDSSTDNIMPAIFLLPIALRGLIVWTLNIILIMFIMVKKNCIKNMGASLLDQILVRIDEKKIIKK